MLELAGISSKERLSIFGSSQMMFLLRTIPVSCMLYLLCFLLFHVGVGDDKESQLRSNLEKAFGTLLDDIEVGVWVGFKNEEFSTGMGFGYSDIENNVPAKDDAIIPSGSITKTITCISILKLCDEGKLTLKDKVYTLVDKYLTQQYGTTLRVLFNNQSEIEKITLQQLLGMKSGLQDYNDTKLYDFWLNNKLYDMPPLEYIMDYTNRTLACTPGDCIIYSSTNYMVAGFVLAQYYGVQDYRDLDQHAIAFAPGTYNLTSFGIKSCPTYPDVPNFYVLNKTDKKTYASSYNSSCLNGWTCGNAIIGVKDAANLYFDIFNEKFASGWNTFQMSQLERVDTGWGTGIPYGLGLMQMSFENYWHHHGSKSYNQNMRYAVGHGGADYGTYITGAYHFTLNFGYSIAINKDNLLGDNENLIWCLAKKAIIETMFPLIYSGNCTSYYPSSNQKENDLKNTIDLKMPKNW